MVNPIALESARRLRAFRRLAFVFVAAPLSWLALGCEPPPPRTPPPPTAPAPVDADGDGILDDGTDKCLIEKEDGLPPDPKDGCKSPDPDGDGILGEADKCPGEPETKNGFEDEDGCPDKAPRVLVTATEVKINEKILFAFGKATIEQASQNLLDEIAFVINDHPQIEYLEVAGHADKVGTDVLNVQLTKQRAQAVLDALVKRKVDKRRMHAQGYGEHCAVDKGESEAAREKNRRVEFKIMRIDGVETGVALGCEEAVKHGIKAVTVPKAAPVRAELEKAKLAHPPVPPRPPGEAIPSEPPKPAAKPGTRPGVVKPPAVKPAIKAIPKKK